MASRQTQSQSQPQDLAKSIADGTKALQSFDEAMDGIKGSLGSLIESAIKSTLEQDTASALTRINERLGQVLGAIALAQSADNVGFQAPQHSGSPDNVYDNI